MLEAVVEALASPEELRGRWQEFVAARALLFTLHTSAATSASLTWPRVNAHDPAKTPGAIQAVLSIAVRHSPAAGQLLDALPAPVDEKLECSAHGTTRVTRFDRALG